MRIIYGRDYYDSAMAYGHDTYVTFVRERNHFCDDKFVGQGQNYPPVLDLRLHSSNPQDSWRYSFADRPFQIVEGKDRISVSLHFAQVIICGKRYRGICLYRFATNEYEYIWNKSDISRWFEKYGLTPRVYSWSIKDPERHANTLLEQYFAVENVKKESLAWLIENKITVLTYLSKLDKLKWRINGDNLKDLQFYKAVDPYTLFQEIEMWLGGVLPGAGNPMVQITDDSIKVAKHGFDKFSFRKQGKTSTI